MAIKKSELYSSLWKSCDELRGGMDASQYKDYVLVLLFVKYVSDKPEVLLKLPVGGSFADLVALKGQADIGDRMNKIITLLAEANDLVGIITVADFNDADKLGKGKEMQDRLARLIAIFENPALDFSKNKAEGDDILGDAYEYLMRHFATESGKSKGQFYTPAEVSRVLAKIVGVQHAKEKNLTLYDPTCGSGSLLLKAATEAAHGISIYGQEMDNVTAALAKMNMFLHNSPDAEIWQDNTLANPHFKDAEGKLKKFDFIVANPPFSTKSWSNGVNAKDDIYQRFESYGIPPDKNGDYAFLLHILKSLKTTGKAAVILPHGVLFRGNAEAEIRKNILQKGYIKGIIGLPANLFYGTGIPACIIILDKENANARKGVFFMDASKGFAKDGNKNRLREQDIRKIVDTFETLQEVPKFSRVVSFQEIENNDYNLNIPRYIDNQELADVQDIRAHLLGGIPQSDIDALADYWAVFPRLRAELFTPTRAGYAQTTLPADALKTHIFEHADFQTYHQHLHQLLQNWQTLHFPLLENIHQQKNAKLLISQLSENILQSFEHQQLIEKYDIYQLLLTYWLDTMQDDVYAVVSDGWQLPILMGKKGEWTCELVPKRLVIQRYFQSEQTAIEQLEAHRDDISRQIEELTEEHNTEDGLLVEARNEKDALTTSSVKDRLKKLKNTNATEEKKILENFLTLSDNLAEAKKKIAQAQTALDDSLLAKYKTLSVPEIQTLLIRDKWFADLRQHFQNELDRLSQGLTQRVHTLAQRYQDPLAQLTASTQTLENTVLQHLQTLGFELA